MDKKYGFMELKSNQSAVYIFGVVQLVHSRIHKMLKFILLGSLRKNNTTTYMHQHQICCKLKPVLFPDIFYSANKS
jgi:hypothetical protein